MHKYVSSINLYRRKKSAHSARWTCRDWLTIIVRRMDNVRYKSNKVLTKNCTQRTSIDCKTNEHLYLGMTGTSRKFRYLPTKRGKCSIHESFCPSRRRLCGSLAKFEWRRPRRQWSSIVASYGRKRTKFEQIVAMMTHYLGGVEIFGYLVAILNQNFVILLKG